MIMMHEIEYSASFYRDAYEEGKLQGLPSSY
jgi:hypothetical protein